MILTVDDRRAVYIGDESAGCQVRFNEGRDEDERPAIGGEE